MLIFTVALSIGLGLKAVPEALQHLPVTLKMLLSTELLPVAFIGGIFNLVLPEED